MEFHDFRFRDVAQLVNGRAYLMPELQSEGKYKIVRVGNFTGKDEWFYSDMELDEDKYCYKGDLLYKWACTFGPEIWKDEKTIYHYHIWKVIPRSNFSKEFLYYYLKLYTPYWLGSTNGATMVHITKSTMENKKVFLPSYEEQCKIADILLAYDDLIENNNRRIALLEKAAQELYKEWFVRFRFPGHETDHMVESCLGKTPSSFSFIKMNEAFDYYIGGGWGNDECSADFPEEAYVIRGTDFPNVQKGNLSTCPLRYHKKSNYAARALKANDIIIEVSGGTAEQPVGRTLLVTQDIINRLGGKVICASFCKQIRLNTEVITPYYFYYWMQFLYDTRIIDRFQLQSTGIINFKFEYFLRKGDIMLPPRELMDKFDKKVKTLYEEIAILARQNENLAKQRDLLLPRLMSGKLEV